MFLDGKAVQREEHKKMLHVSTGSYYSFDQRNFWKQELEARMHGVEERVGEEMSRGSEFRPL